MPEELEDHVKAELARGPVVGTQLGDDLQDCLDLGAAAALIRARRATLVDGRRVPGPNRPTFRRLAML